MTSPYTAAELAAILARADAATPGPWEVRNNALDKAVFIESARGNIARSSIRSDSDSAFIAACRADVPRLVAELTLAREALREVAARRRRNTHRRRSIRRRCQRNMADIARAALEEPADER